jgi:uncharacterized membrane protein YhaH (DUF805 family)
MNFVDAVKKCFAKFADFNGRAGLSEFWWFVLFSFLGGLVLNFVSSSLANIFNLVLFVPTIAVTARRLHDINKSGWMQLWWTIGGIIGVCMMVYGFASMLFPGGLAGGGSVALGGLGALIALASFAFAIYLMIKAGDASENLYGPVLEESTSLAA